MIGLGAVLMAVAVVVGAVVVAIAGPQLHRRRPGRAPDGLVPGRTTAQGPVEAKRTAGPSYFASPPA